MRPYLKGAYVVCAAQRSDADARGQSPSMAAMTSAAWWWCSMWPASGTILSVDPGTDHMVGIEGNHPIALARACLGTANDSSFTVVPLRSAKHCSIAGGNESYYQ
jgi:hypothetical protein